MLVSLEISMLILYPKLEPPLLLRWSLVLLPSYSQNPLYPVSQMGSSHFNNPPIPSELSLSYSFSVWIGLLTPHMRWAFRLRFNGHISYYNCRKLVVRKTLPAAHVNTLYRTLIIFFLTVLPLILYANLSLAQKSAPRRVAQLFSLCEASLLLHLSEEVGMSCINT